MGYFFRSWNPPITPPSMSLQSHLCTHPHNITKMEVADAVIGHQLGHFRCIFYWYWCRCASCVSPISTFPQAHRAAQHGYCKYNTEGTYIGAAHVLDIFYCKNSSTSVFIGWFQSRCVKHKNAL